MNEAKILLRESENAVLLVCDFYETRQIPVEMTTEKNNLSLFPVANIPLIEYILSSLLKQNLKNIIITGKCIERIREVVQSMNIFNCMNIIFMEIEGNNLGDVLRIMKDNDLDVKDLLIMYANHYTNYDLNSIFNKHRLNNFLMTLFLHKGNSNSKINHFYGFKKDQIVFYEKCINGKYNIQHIKDSLDTNKTVNYHFNLSSPTIGVISGDVLRVFGENFDYATLGDLLEGLLAFNPFNHQIGFIKEEDKGILCYCNEMVCYCVWSYNNDRLFGENGVVNDDRAFNNGVVNDNGSLGINGSLNLSLNNPTSPSPHNPTTPSPNTNPTTPTTTPLSNWNLLRLSLSNWYSREIITLFDYFIFNEDVKSGSFVDISDYPRRVDGEFKKLTFYQGNYFYDLFLFMDNNVVVNNTVLGTKNRLNNDSKLENCFVGDGCTINGNISKCIVWDDIHINQDLDGYIVFSKDHKIPFTHLEIEMDLEEEVIDTTNFFDDLVGYLKDCLDSVRKDKIQIEEVIKQVNMLRIIWNASDLDLIEAFSVFLTDIVSPEDVEDSAINGSFFFPILENTVNTPKKQQELLVLIWNQMKDLDLDFKKNVFCIYAYQLFEDGVISRSVYKEYNMLVLKNLL